MFATFLSEMLCCLCEFCHTDDLKKMSLVSKHYNKHTSLRRLLSRALYISITGEKQPEQVSDGQKMLEELKFLVDDEPKDAFRFLQCMADTLYSEDQFIKNHSKLFTRPIHSYFTLGPIMIGHLYPARTTLHHFDRENERIIERKVHEIFRICKTHYKYLRRQNFTVLALIY